MVIHFSYTPIGEHFCYLNRKISKIGFVSRICHSKHKSLSKLIPCKTYLKIDM